ncbi:MAG: Hsp70 family protein [Bacillota bacterium]|nr:Hsp70 family protein [Bacillota bacterium]
MILIIIDILAVTVIVLLFSSAVKPKKKVKVEDKAQRVIIDKDEAATINNLVKENIGIGTLDGRLIPLIKKGEKVPCKRSLTFTTSEDNQEHITLGFYRGTNELTEKCTFLGQYRITKFLPMDAGQPIVQVTIEVDNKHIYVYVKDLKSKCKLSIKRLTK